MNPIAEETPTLPVIEENLTIEKRPVTTGKVVVRTRTSLEEVVVRESLTTEVLGVTRVPIGRVVESAPEVRQDGDVTVVPVLEERLVITKELVLREEIHIRRRVSAEQVSMPVTLRKQEVTVERNGDSLEPRKTEDTQ